MYAFEETMTSYLRNPLIVALSKSKKVECNDGSSKQISSWCNEVVEGNSFLCSDPSTNSTLRIKATKARIGTLTFLPIKRDEFRIKLRLSPAGYEQH